MELLTELIGSCIQLELAQIHKNPAANVHRWESDSETLEIFGYNLFVEIVFIFCWKKP